MLVCPETSSLCRKTQYDYFFCDTSQSMKRLAGFSFTSLVALLIRVCQNVRLKHNPRAAASLALVGGYHTASGTVDSSGGDEQAHAKTLDTQIV